MIWWFNLFPVAVFLKKVLVLVSNIIKGNFANLSTSDFKIH